MLQKQSKGGLTDFCRSKLKIKYLYDKVAITGFYSFFADKKYATSLVQCDFYPHYGRHLAALMELGSEGGVPLLLSTYVVRAKVMFSEVSVHLFTSWVT